MKPLKPRSNHTVLRTVADFRGSHGSIFLLYLAGKQILVHKEFEHKKKKKKKIAREKKKTESQVGEVANITINFLVVYIFPIIPTSYFILLLLRNTLPNRHPAAARNSSPHVGSCFLSLSSVITCIVVFLFLLSVPTVLPDKTTTTWLIVRFDHSIVFNFCHPPILMSF